MKKLMYIFVFLPVALLSACTGSGNSSSTQKTPDELFSERYTHSFSLGNEQRTISGNNHSYSYYYFYDGGNITLQGTENWTRVNSESTDVFATEGHITFPYKSFESASLAGSAARANNKWATDNWSFNYRFKDFEINQYNFIVASKVSTSSDGVEYGEYQEFNSGHRAQDCIDLMNSAYHKLCELLESDQIPISLVLNGN